MAIEDCPDKKLPVKVRASLDPGLSFIHIEELLT